MPLDYQHKYVYIIITVCLYNFSKIAYKELGSARHNRLHLLLKYFSFSLHLTENLEHEITVHNDSVKQLFNRSQNIVKHRYS